MPTGRVKGTVQHFGRALDEKIDTTNISVH